MGVHDAASFQIAAGRSMDFVGLGNLWFERPGGEETLPHESDEIVFLLHCYPSFGLPINDGSRENAGGGR
jgi:hypothetical protein